MMGLNSSKGRAVRVDLGVVFVSEVCYLSSHEGLFRLHLPVCRIYQQLGVEWRLGGDISLTRTIPEKNETNFYKYIHCGPFQSYRDTH